MKGRTKVPAATFDPDQLVQLLSHLEKYDPTAWMINDANNSDDCWTDDYRYVMRDDIESVLAENALAFAVRQWEGVKARGYRLN